MSVGLELGVVACWLGVVELVELVVLVVLLVVPGIAATAESGTVNGGVPDVSVEPDPPPQAETPIAKATEIKATAVFSV